MENALTCYAKNYLPTGSLVAANVAGHTKRTTANGVEFVFYAAGNIVGPFLFDSKEAPRYITAIKALAGLYGASIFFTAALAIIMLRCNRKRAKEDIPEIVGDEQGFMDRTDKENT